MQLLHGAFITAPQCLDLIVPLGETFCIACFANGKAIKDELQEYLFHCALLQFTLLSIYNTFVLLTCSLFADAVFQRHVADQILRELQNNPDMWLQVVHILQNSQNLNTKFFALQVSFDSRRFFSVDTIILNN